MAADDKLGIVDALQYLQENPSIPHGAVRVAFDYTLDCCGIDEFVCKNWHAGDAILISPGQSAKSKLKNFLFLAHKLISLLPEGYHPVDGPPPSSGHQLRIPVR